MNVYFHILYKILQTFCSLFSFKNLLLKYILLWNQFYYNMADINICISFSRGSNNLTNYGRRHFKLFTNCHVSWDTLYLILTVYSTVKWDSSTFFLSLGLENILFICIQSIILSIIIVAFFSDFFNFEISLFAINDRGHFYT